MKVQPPAPPAQGQFTIHDPSKMVSALAAAVPVCFAIATYFNDPGNYTGLLVCGLLLVSILFWRNTNQQLQEVKAACAALQAEIEEQRDELEAQRNRHDEQIRSVYEMHSAYKAVAMMTAMNMFAHITRTAGQRDCGTVSLDEKTGAPLYKPPPAAPPPQSERRQVPTPAPNTIPVALPPDASMDLRITRPGVDPSSGQPGPPL